MTKWAIFCQILLCHEGNFLAQVFSVHFLTSKVLRIVTSSLFVEDDLLSS